MSEKTDLLQDAMGTVTQRNEEYGDPTDDFGRIATMWSILFKRQFTPHDVAMAMICLKLSRLTWAPGNRDSWLDVAGYAGCGWQCAVQEEKNKAMMSDREKLMEDNT